MTDAAKTTVRDPNLDLVRSVAILSVIAGHSQYVAPGQGYLGHGVDIFFCLSGFLIGRIFLKEESRGFSFLRFWTDRWLRTVPPYFFVLFLGLGLGQSGISSSWWSLPQFEGRFWQYVAFVQNYGAISSLPSAPFGVSWSLCVEEQFYLALPVLFLLVRSFAARALLLSSVVATAVVTRSVVNEGDWFYTSHYRFDGIALGVLAALLAVRFPALQAHAARWQSPSAVAWLAVLLLRPAGYWPASLDFISVLDLATTAVLFTGADGRPLPGARSRLNRYTARISYSLYLTHANVYRMVERSWPGEHFVLDVMRVAVALVSVYLAGALVYQLAERPSYALRARLREKLRPAGRPPIPMTHPGWQLQAPAYRALAVSAAGLLALAMSLSLGLNGPLRMAWSNWFDDGRELLVYQPTGGWWMRRLLSTGWTSVAGGQGEGFLPVPGDYDGDGKVDLASYQRATGLWVVPRSSGEVVMRSIEGAAGPNDVPVPADYDGDGRTDLAVYDPSAGVWLIEKSGSGRVRRVSFGESGARPIPGDYDGDGRVDLALYRSESAEWIFLEAGERRIVQYGMRGYVPVPADYDGDGRTDISSWHEASGLWYVQGQDPVRFDRGPGCVPTPADYDGDGRADMALYNEAAGIWYLRRSGGGGEMVHFGGPGWVPALRAPSPARRR